MADLVDIADGVVGVIQATWAAYSEPPGPSDAVTRVYQVNVADADFWEQLTGRQVYVFVPGKYETEMATRSDDYRDHTLNVLAVERYTGQSATPDVSWLDDRVRWAQTVVWRQLDNRRLPPIVPNVWPQDGAEIVTYDVEELIQRKLFVTFVTARLRELVTNTPP